MCDQIKKEKEESGIPPEPCMDKGKTAQLKKLKNFEEFQKGFENAKKPSA